MPTAIWHMPHWRLMRYWIASLVACLVLVIGHPIASAPYPLVPVASAQDIDEDVPPGNPVIGDDRPGDFESEGTNYALWALVAICLIGAGTLLIKIERWEARRLPGAE